MALLATDFIAENIDSNTLAALTTTDNNEEPNMQKTKTSFLVAMDQLWEVGTRVKRLAIFLLFLFCAACSASRYSSADAYAEIEAEVTRDSGYSRAIQEAAAADMKEKCNKAIPAMKERKDLSKNLDVAIQKATDERNPNSPDVAQAFENYKNFREKNDKEIDELERSCRQALLKFNQITDARDKAATPIIERYRHERRSINCISNQIGSNTYTSCN